MPVKDELEEESLLASDSMNMNFEEITIIENDSSMIESIKVEVNQPSKSSKNNFKMSAFDEYSAKVNWNVFFAICLFTLGAWLDISGNYLIKNGTFFL